MAKCPGRVLDGRPKAGYEYFEAAGHVASGESASVRCTGGWTGVQAFSSVNRPTFERMLSPR